MDANGNILVPGRTKKNSILATYHSMGGGCCTGDWLPVTGILHRILGSDALRNVDIESDSVWLRIMVVSLGT